MQEDESIENYDFSARARNVLLRAGIKTISAFQTLKRKDIEGLLYTKNCGISTVTEIIHFWENQVWKNPICLNQMPQQPDPVARERMAKNITAKTAMRRSLAQHPFLGSIEDMSPRRLVDYLISLIPKARERDVVCQRWGFWDKNKKTLDELGYKLCLTREGVRQIQAKAERKLETLSHQIVKEWLLKTYECRIKSYLSAHAGMATIEDVLSQDKTDDGLALVFLSSVVKIPLVPSSTAFPVHGKIIFMESGLMEKFQKIGDDLKRILASKGRPMEFEVVFLELQHYGHLESKEFLKRCLEVSDEVGFDYASQVCLKEWDCFNPQHIIEMAEKALQEIGQPAHFTHIVDKMNILFPDRAPFNLHSVHGRIGTTESKFVRVKRGTYALKNWGIRRPPYIKDFLVRAITQRGGTAVITDLVAEGRTRHGYKETSMRMTLSMNSNIFKVLPSGICKLI